MPLRRYSLFMLLLSTSSLLFGQDVVKLEAESATLSGTHLSTARAGFSGTGFVTGFDELGDHVLFEFTIEDAGTYTLSFGYSAPHGNKKQAIWLDGAEIMEVVFANTSQFEVQYAGDVFLNSGTHTISVVYDWGYFDLDYMTLSIPVPVDYTRVEPLINEQSTTETSTLYNRLKEAYGQFVFTGHTSSHEGEIETAHGKQPALVAWDFDTYSPQYAYKWVNGAHGFGAVENGTTAEIIQWYQETNACGIPTIQWHWHSPSGGTAGTNTFYVENTSFDISKAVVPGNNEYNEVIRDIDAIAVQLKKLQDAEVPVLWRPLHEAHGSWFWWGADGPGPVIALYQLMYDRLTNHHQLNNLIWVWSSEGKSYYPGNEWVDVWGYDSYPDPFDYSSQKGVFQQMYHVCDGRKILALSENGAIPSISALMEEDAMWSYFMTWDDFHKTENDFDHVQSVYDNPAALTLDVACQISSTDNVMNDVSTHVQLYPNPSASTIHLTHVGESDRWRIYDGQGKNVGAGYGDEVDISTLVVGTYAIVVNEAVLTFVKSN